jgi:hypothetical protein
LFLSRRQGLAQIIIIHSRRTPADGVDLLSSPEGLDYCADLETCQ